MICKPLTVELNAFFESYPLSEAMPTLLPKKPLELAKDLSFIQGLPLALQAGIWLYVDDLNRSHEISQNLETQSGSLWHAIMHRREGDFWNSKYWFRRAKGHPFFDQLSFDPSDFVDQVERSSGDSEALLATQREEWKVLFDLCLMESL